MNSLRTFLDVWLASICYGLRTGTFSPSYAWTRMDYNFAWWTSSYLLPLPSLQIATTHYS
jgi:hypothetical protein